MAQRAPVLGIHNPFPCYQTRHVQHESDRDVCNRGLQEARTHVEHGTSNSEEVHDPVVIPIFLPGLVCSSPIEMNSLDGQMARADTWCFQDSYISDYSSKHQSIKSRHMQRPVITVQDP